LFDDDNDGLWLEVEDLLDTMPGGAKSKRPTSMPPHPSSLSSLPIQADTLEKDRERPISWGTGNESLRWRVADANTAMSRDGSLDGSLEAEEARDGFDVHQVLDVFRKKSYAESFDWRDYYANNQAESERQSLFRKESEASVYSQDTIQY
jgi:hypothetical protein